NAGRAIKSLLARVLTANRLSVKITLVSPASISQLCGGRLGIQPLSKLHAELIGRAGEGRFSQRLIGITFDDCKRPRKRKGAVIKPRVGEGIEEIGLGQHI